MSGEQVLENGGLGLPLSFFRDLTRGKTHMVFEGARESRCLPRFAVNHA
jgi:hypothetical protein